MANLKDIIAFFEKGKTPKYEEFKESWTSFWHKSERIRQENILGLNDTLNSLASKEDLKNATTNFKGYHSSIAKLQEAYPQADNKKSWFAWVGSKPTIIWKVIADGGAWINTGDEPTEQEIDLAEYAKKVDLDVKAEKKTIYNVSQINNTYDYATSIIARNAVLPNYHVLGIIISYQLVSGEWITEQYLGVNVASWSAKENWKFIGGLSPEDIYQKVDNTEDKPISPNGVLTGLLDVQGIDYTEESTGDNFVNIITTYDKVVGKILSNTDGVTETVLASQSYNAAFCPAKPSTLYLTNTGANIAMAILCYDDTKKYIGAATFVSDKYIYRTRQNTAFVRYNFLNNLVGDIYIYELPTTIKGDKLAIRLGIGQIQGAIAVDADIQGENLIPTNAVASEKGLDQNNNPILINWYHTDTYIPVEGGKTYTTNIGGANVALWHYDSGKRPIGYIKGKGDAIPLGDFTTPINGGFVRLNIFSPRIDLFYVRQSNAGGAVYIPNLVIPKENVIEIGGTGEVKEVIPYAADGNSSMPVARWFGYVKQDLAKGKYIESLKVNMSVAGDFIVAFSLDGNGSLISWQQTTSLVVGENIIPINKTLKKEEFLLFKGTYRYRNDRINPIGGGTIGGDNFDLCIGINAVSDGTSKAKIEYISIGDSITAAIGYISYAKLLEVKLDATLTNYGVPGVNVMGTEGMYKQALKVPIGFDGLISNMFGVNDYNRNVVVGDVTAVLNKTFEELDPNVSFAESFRLNVETILRRAPDAIFINILPLYSGWTGLYPLEDYREVQREICNYFSVPCLELYRTCKLSPLTVPKYYYDQTHPKQEGYEEITRVLYKEVLMYLK